MMNDIPMKPLCFIKYLFQTQEHLSDSGEPDSMHF